MLISTHAICKIPTPLSLGIAFHVYNETRSKSLISLLNHMNLSVGYDTFHRYITAMCEQMMDDEKEEGIYTPAAIKGCKFIQFAIDNADWHEKTPDGSTFHAMTTNIYGYDKNFDTSFCDDQNQDDNADTRCMINETRNTSLSGNFGDIPLLL